MHLSLTQLLRQGRWGRKGAGIFDHHSQILGWHVFKGQEKKKSELTNISL